LKIDLHLLNLYILHLTQSKKHT